MFEIDVHLYSRNVQERCFLPAKTEEKNVMSQAEMRVVPATEENSSCSITAEPKELLLGVCPITTLNFTKGCKHAKQSQLFLLLLHLKEDTVKMRPRLYKE